jgi:L-lactate dehydrogenase complex protein LldG
MGTALVAEFEQSLDRRGVTWSRTQTDAFESALREAVIEPAVGAPLGIEAVSLADTDVVVDPTPRQLLEARTGVTAAQFGVSASGSLFVQSDVGGTEQVSLYPDRHVAVLRASDLVADLPSALDRLGDEFAAGRDSAVFATGPSATGDMGALIEGVHGPRDVHVLLLEDR